MRRPRVHPLSSGLLSLGLLLLAGCRAAPDTSVGPAATPAQAAPSATTAGLDSGVALLPSFQVRAEPGGGLPSHVPAVAFSPDGRTLWIGTSQGEAIAFDAATRVERGRARLTEAALVAMAIDPSARLLCWLGGGALEVRPLAALRRGQATDAPEPGQQRGRVEGLEDAKALALAGDLVAVGRAGRVELRRLPTLELVRAADVHEGAVTSLAFSPDGRRLASVSDDGELVVLAVGDLTPLRRVATGDELYATCWTPAGDQVLFGGVAKAVDRLDAATWAVERLLEDQPYDVTTLGVSPDGARLAVGDESCDVWVFALPSLERLFHGKHHVECWLSAVAWAPDSQTFLFGCRPNTHDDAPALFAANRAAEAWQDEEHLALVEAERQALREVAALAEGGDLALPEDDGQALLALLVAREARLAGAPLAAPAVAAGSGGGAGGVLTFDDEGESEGEGGGVFSFDDGGGEAGGGVLSFADGGGGAGGGALSFDADEQDPARDLRLEEARLASAASLTASRAGGAGEDAGPRPELGLGLSFDADEETAEAEEGEDDEDDEDDEETAAAAPDDPLTRALADLALDDLPAATRAALMRLAEVQARRRAALERRLRALQAGFQVNVWRAAR